MEDSDETREAERRAKLAPVAAYVEAYREAHEGRDPPKRVRAGVGAAVARLEAEGVPRDVLRRAAVLLVGRGMTGSMLDEMVPTAEKHMRDEREGFPEARAYIEEFGWPTGVRFVRGTHGGAFRADPLGHDAKPFYAIPDYERPTLASIARALKEIHADS